MGGTPYIDCKLSASNLPIDVRGVLNSIGCYPVLEKHKLAPFDRDTSTWNTWIAYAAAGAVCTTTRATGVVLPRNQVLHFRCSDGRIILDNGAGGDKPDKERRKDVCKLHFSSKRVMWKEE